MSNKTLYSIILPVYNQRENLPIILHIINGVGEKQYLFGYIVVVEDKSPDGTRQIAHDLVSVFKNLKIQVLQRAGKMGLGSAYKDGIKLCKGEFIIIMDADLSHHPKYIPVMIERQIQTNADIVTGTRYKTDGGVEGWNFYRKLTSRTANFVTKFVLSINSSDFTGSFRLYRKSSLVELMEQTVTKGYAFQMQILVRAKRMDLKIEEVPIVFVDRLFGKSKLGSNQIFIYLKGVAKLFFEA